MKKLFTLSSLVIPATSLLYAHQAPPAPRGGGSSLWLIVLLLVVIVSVIFILKVMPKMKRKESEKTELSGIKQAIFWICFIVAVIVFILLASGGNVGESALLGITIAMVIGLAILRAKLYS